MNINKPLVDWTFAELARYCSGQIMFAIPVGKFNPAVEEALDLALRWKAERDKKEPTL